MAEEEMEIDTSNLSNQSNALSALEQAFQIYLKGDKPVKKKISI